MEKRVDRARSLCPVSSWHVLYFRTELTWGELKLSVHRMVAREDLTK